jgi:hypothetical protein
MSIKSFFDFYWIVHSIDRRRNQIAAGSFNVICSKKEQDTVFPEGSLFQVPFADHTIQIFDYVRNVVHRY